MTFPANAGVMLPEDFEVVHRVYADISNEPWFTRSPDRQEQLAVFVLDTFRLGVQDMAGLRERCRTEAELRFGDGGIRQIVVSPNPTRHADL